MDFEPQRKLQRKHWKQGLALTPATTLAAPLQPGHSKAAELGPHCICLSFPSYCTAPNFTRRRAHLVRAHLRLLVLSLLKGPSSGALLRSGKNQSHSRDQRQTIVDRQDEFRPAKEKSFIRERRHPGSSKATAHAVVEYGPLCRVARRCRTSHPNRWPAKLQRAAQDGAAPCHHPCAWSCRLRLRIRGSARELHTHDGDMSVCAAVSTRSP